MVEYPEFIDNVGNPVETLIGRTDINLKVRITKRICNKERWVKIVKIVYIPLDERPCNYFYPSMIASMDKNINFITPAIAQLGKKKKPADVKELWRWLENEVQDCDAAILSVEMLVYGGLLYSRIHQMTFDECKKRVNRIRRLKAINPKLNLFVSTLVMRTPTYNSNEEEPHYYDKYGEAIFRYGWLCDKKNREGLTSIEADELERVCHIIPKEFIDDYTRRREINIKVCKEVLTLVKEGVIDFLAIPQDDSAPYGFTAADQRVIIEEIESCRLQSRVYIYPGADEVGCTLLARIYTQLLGKKNLIYVYYSSTMGGQIIPKYEDRPLGESIKAHIIAAGALMTDDVKEADLILMVNSPGKLMQESWEQDRKDITYNHYRNLREFVERIKYYLKQHKKCIVADVAFSNGGDTELIDMMAQEQLLNKLYGYAGWNTACNTLGTVISTGIVGLYSDVKSKRYENIVYHLLEDWGYQSLVRQQVVNDLLPELQASYYNLSGHEEVIKKVIRQRLVEIWEKFIQSNFDGWSLNLKQIDIPWHRMFEIYIDISLENSIDS